MSSAFAMLFLVVGIVCAAEPKPETPEIDEAFLFTPTGFAKPGIPAVFKGTDGGRVKLTILDRQTGKPTFCRINVVGSDGNYYQPAQNYLTPWGLTGNWPKTGKGNRSGKGPFRYYGRFFYSWGEALVDVPAGPVRIEVWKGYEFQPQNQLIQLAAGETKQVRIALTQPEPMTKYGYFSGDPHVHITQESDTDEQLILDLLEAEDLHVGTILAYNDPPGPYKGVMSSLDMPQRALGPASIRRRGDYTIVSGQEYRSSTYGHLNLFLRKDLALPGQELNANDWPLYGQVGRETQEQGGYAFYAHGGYALSIYADFVQGDVNGVELLQFGVYRGIGLEDWYRILNIGYRFPAIAASDFPACRKLADCITYVHSRDSMEVADWLRSAAEGRSFLSTGPLMLLEVEGEKPGARIEKQGPGPFPVKVHLRVRSEIAPVDTISLIVNGKTVKQIAVPERQRQATWIELKEVVPITASSWIAARAFSTTSKGLPDAEAHTNPVYVYVDGKAPYDRPSIDELIAKLDGQIAKQKERKFKERAQVLVYFERSRDILLKIREKGGVPAEGHPADILKNEVAANLDPGTRTHTEAELKEFLKPIPARSPAEALQAFETIPGFHIEEVSSEPLVFDPCAAAFDENGALYVAELLDYPFFPKPGQKPIGNVRLLRDTDGDGRFDKSTVFADELLWAGGVAPWKGGVFVAAPPDIWYLKDTDGDDKADIRRKVFTGFGTKNQQAILNNLQFGMDHKIYGSTAGNGGTVRHADHPDSPGISVDGKDFRFDPVSEAFETITGTVQFGNSFDDWGNRFLCSESRPLSSPILPQHYLARNPFLPVPRAIDDIAGGAVPIFRISPLERWRMIRSSRRIALAERDPNSAGASHHVIDAGAGVTVYRGGAYPADFYGNIFIGDAQNNLIHRMRVTPQGVSFKSERADRNTEFVRTPDNWFRPVNFLNAPDGTLYVLDMNREIIESIHIPMDVVKHLDLKNGRQQGRIYRIAPDGFRYPGTPRLGDLTTAQLVATLESPHGWWRDTAHRLLFERQDRGAVELLRKLLTQSAHPEARLLALWSLAGLESLSDEDLALALRDNVPAIEEHAARLSESRFDQSSALRDAVLALADSPHSRLRFQAAFSLGQMQDARASEALARIVKRDTSDKWIPMAVLSSVAHSAGKLSADLLQDAKFPDQAAGQAFLGQLALIVGTRNDSAEVRDYLELLANSPKTAALPALQRQLVFSLGDGLRQSGSRLPLSESAEKSGERFLQGLFTSAAKTAGDDTAAESARVEAVRLLGGFDFSRSRDALVASLDPHQPPAVQLAAVRALNGYPAPEIATPLVASWRQYAPEVRTEVTRTLLSREPWIIAFLEAGKSDPTVAASIDPVGRERLRQHHNAAIRELAAGVFGPEAANPRKEIVAQYQRALQISGDAARGAKLFERECSACHRLGDKGVDLAPNLASSSVREPGALLMNILDPNQYLLPAYVQYVVVDTNGRTFTGLMASQTATSVTLKREKGEADTILRSNIEELVTTGKSLMPEGLEKKISIEEMADLIAFLAQSQAGQQPRLDIGTEPGLIEPD